MLWIYVNNREERHMKITCVLQYKFKWDWITCKSYNTQRCNNMLVPHAIKVASHIHTRKIQIRRVILWGIFVRESTCYKYHKYRFVTREKYDVLLKGEKYLSNLRALAQGFERYFFSLRECIMFHDSKKLILGASLV